MLYNTGLEWKRSSNKRISLFGMSGVGKTFIANILRESKEWFHYSVDYRIGTRYTTSSQFSGKMGPIYFYNKVLSAAEVLQNFNAQQSRFL